MFVWQSESTLWRLKFFVKEALQVQGKSAASTGDTNNNNDNNKRKREICDALAKTSQKRSKKLPQYIRLFEITVCVKFSNFPFRCEYYFQLIVPNGTNLISSSERHSTQIWLTSVYNNNFRIYKLVSTILLFKYLRVKI